MILKRILKRIVQDKAKAWASVSLALVFAATGIQASKIDNNKSFTSEERQESKQTKSSQGDKVNQLDEQSEEDSLYSIGSVSKMFTTVAVMQLVENGKIDLDVPITTYLPEFRMADERYRQITTRMLLNHSSGLMGSTFSNNILYEDNDTKAHNELIQKLSTQRLKADPGLYSTYCNDGFVLAEIIVERVSGQSFTDYLQEHIFNPLEMKHSGTPINKLNNPFQVATYFDQSTLFGAEYCNVIGTGGILSTAEDLCKFGATFVRDHNALLSNESLEEMCLPVSKQSQYGYIEEGSLDQYGLGWDSVAAYRFSKHGITALLKGGDIVQQHGMLMVLPEENISISVLSSGGNSTFNELLAQELATIALEEQGIIFEDEELTSTKIGDLTETEQSIPEEYLSYAGEYANVSGIYRISFPNQQYLQIESCDTEIPRVQTYHYTKEDIFVADDHQYISTAGIVSPSALQSGKTTLTFKTEADGKQYLCIDTYLKHAEVGESRLVDLFAEKMEPNTLTASVQKAWEERNGKKYYLVSEKYSSGFWTMNPMLRLKLSTVKAGYINASGRIGTTKITDENRAEAFITLPGGMGRDLNDLSMIQRAEGEYLYLEDASLCYIEETQIPDLDLETSNITLKEASAKWYNIGDNAKGKTIFLKPSNQMAVYIYDEYDECIYSSYMKNRGNKVILPKQGKMVVVGEAGSQLQMQAS